MLTKSLMQAAAMHVLACPTLYCPAAARCMRACVRACVLGHALTSSARRQPSSPRPGPFAAHQHRHPHTTSTSVRNRRLLSGSGAFEHAGRNTVELQHALLMRNGAYYAAPRRAMGLAVPAATTDQHTSRRKTQRESLTITLLGPLLLAAGAGIAPLATSTSAGCMYTPRAFDHAVQHSVIRSKAAGI